MSLIVEGENLSEAYEKLEKEKAVYFKKVIELDVRDTIEEPAPIKLRKKLFTDLPLFFIRLSIIVFVVGILLFVSVSIASPVVSSQLRQIPRQTMDYVLEESMVFVAELPGRINDALNNMPAEKKEEIRLELRDAIQQAKPFIDEFRVLLEDENTME